MTRRLIKILLGVLMALILSGAWCADAQARGHGHVFIGGGVFIGPGWYGPGPWYDPWYGPGPYYYPPPNYGWLRTNIEPNDAEVWVDGTYSGHAYDYDGPVNHLRLPVGDHTVEFSMPGYQRFSTDFRVNPGGTTVVEYDLRPLPPPGKEGYREGYGVLSVKVLPAETGISVDGKFFAKSKGTAVDISLPAGTHQVELSKEGYTSYYTEVSVPDGGTADIDVTLGPEGAR
jgi:hypothetical protein